MVYIALNFNYSSFFNICVLQARLDLVAESGLPIWITELTVFEANNTKKAQAFEDLLTLYFR